MTVSEWSLGAAGPLLMREEREEAAWRDRARCAETDPEAFYPEKGEPTEPARRVCRNCEVRVQCLEYALANDERFGVWGGLSVQQRRRLKVGASTPIRDASGHIRGWAKPADVPAGETRRGEAQQRTAA